MIAHLPRTLVERTLQAIDRRGEFSVQRNSVIRRACTLMAALSNSFEEMPEPDLEMACWWIGQALEVHEGACDSLLHERIRKALGDSDLKYLATGVA